jgi:PAS domain-containing protein
LGTNWLARFSSPGQRLSAQDALAHVMAGRAESSEIDGDLRTAGGNSRHVTWRCVPIRDDNGRVAAALCAGEDDTAQRDSQQLFDDLVGVLNDIVYTIDTDQRLTSVFGDLGDGERRVTGSVEMAPRGALGAAAARDHDQANRRALAGEHVVFEWTLSADPTSYHLETSLAPLHSHAGEIVGAIGVIRDVSLLHQMRRQLQAHERCFSTLLSNVPGTVYRCRYDTHWTMEAISAGCLALTGYSPDALVGNRDVAFADLIHPDDRDQVAEAVDRAVAEDRPFQVEYRLLDASGQEKRVWEQGCGVLTSEQPGEAVMLEGYITDVTVLYQARKPARQRGPLSCHF